MKVFPKEFTIEDEIYQIKEFSRDRVRVLMTLDANKLDLANKNVHRTDRDFAVAWARNYGKGRVYYNTLGHRQETWDRPDFRKSITQGIQWALGLLPGDATPRPKP
jgi:type 1 glutamine amidotransferase